MDSDEVGGAAGAVLAALNTAPALPVDTVLLGDCTDILPQLPAGFADFADRSVNYRDRAGRWVAGDRDGA